MGVFEKWWFELYINQTEDAASTALSRPRTPSSTSSSSSVSSAIEIVDVMFVSAKSVPASPLKPPTARLNWTLHDASEFKSMIYQFDVNTVHVVDSSNVVAYNGQDNYVYDMNVKTRSVTDSWYLDDMVVGKMIFKDDLVFMYGTQEDCNFCVYRQWNKVLIFDRLSGRDRVCKGGYSITNRWCEGLNDHIYAITHNDLLVKIEWRDIKKGMKKSY